MNLTIKMDELGGELRRRRNELGLSLREVEEQTRVSAATLSRVERGTTPDVDTITKLAQWLGIAVHAGGKEPSSKGASDDLKRTIEVHLRAKKKIPATLARSIAESFDLVMQIELEKAAAKKGK